MEGVNDTHTCPRSSWGRDLWNLAAKSVSPLLIWQTVPVPPRSRAAALRRDVKASLSLLFGCALNVNEYSKIGVRIEIIGR